MRFTKAVIIAYIAYAGNSGLAAPVPSNDVTDTVQYKRDLETRGRHYAHHRGSSHSRDYHRHGHHRSHSRHSRHRSQSPPPSSPVLTEGETTGEEQHVEKRKNVVNYATGWSQRVKIPKFVIPNLPPPKTKLPDLHLPRFPLPKKPDNSGKPLSPQKPDTQGQPLTSSNTTSPSNTTSSPSNTSPRIVSSILFKLLQKRPGKRDLQELETRGRHHGRRGRGRRGKHSRGSHGGGRRRHRHSHAQPAPVAHEEVAPAEAEGEATPEKRSMSMEIDELD